MVQFVVIGYRSVASKLLRIPPEKSRRVPDMVVEPTVANTIPPGRLAIVASIRGPSIVPVKGPVMLPNVAFPVTASTV